MKMNWKIQFIVLFFSITIFNELYQYFTICFLINFSHCFLLIVPDLSTSPLILIFFQCSNFQDEILKNKFLKVNWKMNLSSSLFGKLWTNSVHFLCKWTWTELGSHLRWTSTSLLVRNYFGAVLSIPFVLQFAQFV